MSKPVIGVQTRGLAATSGGCEVFLGNEEKVFVMLVEQSVGAAIAMFKQGTQKERPLTHDLLANILGALGAKIERVIVNDLKRGIYFARLVLSSENELQQKKIIEIDARPSDCIAMATQQPAPIYVSLSFRSSRLISTSPACCLPPISGRPSPNSCATVFEPSGASLSLQPFGRLVTTSTNASSNSNSKYTYPSSGSYAAWLTLNSNTARRAFQTGG